MVAWWPRLGQPVRTDSASPQTTSLGALKDRGLDCFSQGPRVAREAPGKNRMPVARVKEFYPEDSSHLLPQV